MKKFICTSIGVLCFGAMVFGQGNVLQDDFENLKQEKGKTISYFTDGNKQLKATVLPGIIQIDGDKGKALQLTKKSMVIYPPSKVISPWIGSAKCKIRFDFEPAQENKLNKTIYRNQLFLTLGELQTYSRAILYSCRKDISFLVFNKKRQILFQVNAPYAFKGNTWYDIEVTWGQQIILYVNGKKVASKAWRGLFGPMFVEKMQLFLGSRAGGLENKFSIDSLKVSSEAAGQKPGCIPKAAIPLISNSAVPILDGKLDDQFWKKAVKLTGFVMFNAPMLAEKQPFCLLGYTDKGIYLGMETPLEGGVSPKAMLSKHDSGIFTEDCFEIRLQPGSDKCYGFLFNALGTKYDNRRNLKKFFADKSYNPEWQVKTYAAGNGKWSAEVFIPYKALEQTRMPKSGVIWRGNFYTDTPIGFSYGKSWSYSWGNFSKTSFFGELVFSGQKRALSLENIIVKDKCELDCEFKLAGSFPPIINVNGECFNPLGIPIKKYSFPLRDTPTTTFSSGMLNSGIHNIDLNAVDKKGTVWLRQNFFFKPSVTTTLRVNNYPYGGYARVSLYPGKCRKQAVEAVFTLQAKGKTLKTKKSRFNKGVAETRFNSSKLQPGKYLISAMIKDAGGVTKASAKTVLEIFKKPTWWKNKFGIDNTVPPPWHTRQLKGSLFNISSLYST